MRADAAVDKQLCQAEGDGTGDKGEGGGSKGSCEKPGVDRETESKESDDKPAEEEKKAPRVEQPVARKSGLWGRMGAAADDMMD